MIQMVIIRVNSPLITMAHFVASMNNRQARFVKLRVLFSRNNVCMYVCVYVCVHRETNPSPMNNGTEVSDRWGIYAWLK